MKTFNQFIVEQSKTKNSSKFTWGKNDLKLIKKEKPKFSWRNGDLEVVKKPDNTKENNNLQEQVVSKQLVNTKLTPKQKKEFTEHREAASPESIAAINKYKKEDGDSVNAFLRYNSEKGTSNYKQQIQHIKHLDPITKNKISHPLTVYRGFGDYSSTILKHKPGTIVKDKGYVSTSLKPSKANFFVDQLPHIAKIHVPAGSKGHMLDLNGKGVKYRHLNEHEHEFLLHRGTKFKIHHHSIENGKQVTHMHVIP